MIFTCVMSTLHGTVVVTHSVKIIEIVLWITTHPVWPSPWRPVRRETPAALASLYHVRSHVHTSEWEFDHVLHLHPAIPILKDGTKLSQTRIMFTTSIFTCVDFYLSKAFQMQYEDVRQSPQTELNAALLKLLTVRTSPRVVGC